MNKFKLFLVKYATVLIFSALVIIIELSGAFFTDKTFYIRDPRYLFTVLGILVCILLLIKNQMARLITSSVFLYLHMIINMIFILVFEMTEQWFDLSMLSLRSDAMGILENLPINFPFVFIFLLVITSYITIGVRCIPYINNYIKNNKVEHKKWVMPVYFSTTSFLIVLFIILNVLTGYLINGNLKIDKYDDLIHSKISSLYNQYGATNNFINEIYRRGVFYDEKNLSRAEMEDYIYKTSYDGSTKSEFNGISSGNNVITILGETLEWYSFLGAKDGYITFGNDEKLGINCKIGDNDFKGTGISVEKMRQLYPNLTRYYDEAYILTNYHAREKTDISESYAIMGSYPIDAFIHYDYAKNLKLQSAPNVLRDYYTQQGLEFSAQYYHNGTGGFYNRSNAIPGFGFDKWQASETMKNSNEFVDYFSQGERNFDSQMVKACKDDMFPTDGRKFYTFITTITMHGLYQRQRDNLTDAGYYQELYEASYNAATGTYSLPKIENASGLELSLYTYLAAAKETDKMMGVIFDELETRNLLDNTTIVLFGDHQAYYEGLSNYVKGIYNANDAIEDGIDYNDLYKVPCMIYDKKLVNKATNNHTNELGRFNNKFSSSCDIVPTLLDLQGIKYYDGLYYGNSVFNADSETIIYSRGYGFFVDNYSYFKNINHFKYINPKVTSIYGSVDEYKKHVDEIGTALTVNIKYMDNVYKTNLFNNEESYYTYKNNMYTLNGWDKSKIKTWTN